MKYLMLTFPSYTRASARHIWS